MFFHQPLITLQPSTLASLNDFLYPMRIVAIGRKMVFVFQESCNEIVSLLTLKLWAAVLQP
jgi:hypothetical protein